PRRGVPPPSPHDSRAPPAMLRDLATVKLANVSDTSRALRWPTTATLAIEVRSDTIDTMRGNWETGAEKSGLSLEPGAEVTLVGPDRINPEIEFAILEPLHGPVQIRAVLRPYAKRQQVRVASDWIDFEFD
ncbi:MAG: hypothetical protein AAF721_10040, partial [Myxococcota bacterium]